MQQTTVTLAESDLCQHPFIFFAAMFIAVLFSGVWLGFKFNEWRVARLQRIIESLRFELSLLDPRRIRAIKR